MVVWWSLGWGCGGGTTDETSDAADTDTDADTDSDTDTDADTDSDADQEAYLRVANVAPELGPLDVYTDDRPTRVAGPIVVASGTPFYRVVAGAREVRVVHAGDPPSSQVAAFEGELAAQGHYSGIAWGPEVAPHLDVVLEDNAGLDANHVRYTLFVADPLLPRVDVVDTATATPLGTGLYGERATLPDLEAGARSLGLDLTLDGGVDCSFVVPNAGGKVVVSLYVLTRDGQVYLLAHDPVGALTPSSPVEPTCPVPGTPHTGDTGP